MAKKGLLILIGGRQMPNFLTAQYLKPDLIVPIASKDEIAQGKWDKLKLTFEPLCGNLAEFKEVDAFDLAEIKSKCNEAIAENPDVEWFFNVTCATTVMSIAAYEVAKENDIDCWYLDTNTQRVPALVGNPPESDLYNVSIEDYLKNYGRTIFTKGEENIPAKLQEFVTKLAQDVDFANKFQQSFQQSKNTGIKGQKAVTIQDDDVKNAWFDAEKLGLVFNLSENQNGKLFFNVKDLESSSFLNGGWLELYVWLTAKQSDCFDDIAYSVIAPAMQGAQYELDFALTFAGMLLIAECKTGKTSFEGIHLQRLNTRANHLGSNFVGKIYVTNQTINESSYGTQGFLEQAKQNNIVVVHGGNLHELNNILLKEACVGTSPTYFRG